jgi:hypothetical protein
MATEPNLRNLFQASGMPEARTIDTEAVIRRSRLRRLPAQVGLGGAFTLAIGGIGFVAVQGLGSVQPASTQVESATDSQDTRSAPEAEGVTPLLGEGEIKRAPAERINLCGGTVAEVAPSVTGLVLSTSFPDAAVGAGSVEGTVTLTNTGTAPVSGYSSAAPAITLAQNGIVLWHSNGPTIQLARDVVLAPGESQEYTASFSPVVCAVEDDLGESFRDRLPAAPAGEYQVSAAADIVIDGTAELVTGAAQTVRIG